MTYCMRHLRDCYGTTSLFSDLSLRLSLLQVNCLSSIFILIMYTPWIMKLQNEIHVKIVIYWTCMITLTTFYLCMVESTLCTKAVVSCLLIAFTFVGSLYIWKLPYSRDHPKIIVRRFASVSVTLILSPIFVILFTNVTDDDGSITLCRVLELLGIRFSGIIEATIVPFILTVILFLGPLVSSFFEVGVYHYFDYRYWYANSRDLIWLRNHIMAPFYEEFSFRACMLPLLVQCFSEGAAVFVCPVFFGVAHAHLLIERLRHGFDLKTALSETIFQFLYTTIFGAYSAFLFLRTGHFVAPLVVHSFCNHMGFPDFGEIFTYSPPKKYFITSVYLIGFFTWLKYLYPLTSPALYNNTLFWQEI